MLDMEMENRIYYFNKAKFQQSGKMPAARFNVWLENITGHAYMVGIHTSSNFSTRIKAFISVVNVTTSGFNSCIVHWNNLVAQ